MKRISYLFILCLFLVLAGCANTSGGMLPEMEPESIQKEEIAIAPEEEIKKIAITLEGITSLSQNVSAGNAGMQTAILQKKSGSSDFEGIAVEVDEANPENLAVAVEFASSEETVNKKLDAIESSIAKAFKDKLYGAGVESITSDNVSVHIDASYESATAIIAGLKARTEFEFAGATPTIEIALEGNFTGYIDLTAVTSKEVVEIDGKAGIKASWLLADEVHYVSFTGADVFETSKQLEALKAMVEESFIPALTAMNVKTNFGAKTPTVKPAENKATMVLELNAPDGLSFSTATSKGNKTEVVEIEFTNEYGAFAGVRKIEQSEITVPSLVPSVTNAVVIGTSGWAISGGSTPGATRKVAVGEDSSVSAIDVIESIAAKIEDKTSSNKYSYVEYGSFTKDESTDRVVFPVVFEKKDGYLFFDGKPTHSVDFGYVFSVGPLAVNDEDFAETLKVLEDPKNLKALADSSGTVTLDITEDITNEKDSSGNATPFTVNGNGEELNLVLETSVEDGASVSGGGILTSLIVKGNKTTVTIGEGVSVNAGRAEVGGGIIVDDGATFVLDGGTITGNTSTISNWAKGGGAVSVLHGTFIMNSGAITGNAALRGAGVFVSSESAASPSAFIMNGGSIDNNTTVIGAVKATSGSVATGGGTGVFLYGAGASFTMNDGTIRDNQASRMGSAITISTSAKVTINDGLITGNIGPFGVIGAAGSAITFVMKGGTIENNTYGPLNADGTPNTALIATTDTTAIKEWLNGIENGVVSNYHSVKMNTSWTGGTINGERP